MRSAFASIVVLLLVASSWGQSQVKVGGNGGGPWDNTFASGYKLSALTLWESYGYYVASLGQMNSCYKKLLPNGQYDNSVPEKCLLVGSGSFSKAMVSMTLAADEDLATVTGTATNFVRCFTAVTTQGQSIAVPNCDQASPPFFVDLQGKPFLGFSGRQGDIVDAVYFNFGPTAVCGNGKLEPGESCDAGAVNGQAGSCCTANCTFASSTLVCRASAGQCDVAETCTGSSDACPVDTVKPVGTPCGEEFGACDVQLSKSCNGASAQCYGPPTVPFLASSQISWTDFTVTSFNNFNCSGGDVEGRLAVRHDAVFNDFTVGLELTLATDGYHPYTVVAGGDVFWSSGELHPSTNDNSSVVGPPAFIVTGGDFTGAASVYLADQHIGNFSNDRAFQAVQTYYTTIQGFMAAVPINTVNSLKYGDGLFIECNNKADLLYHTSVDASVFSSINWYSLSNCNFASRWIIDITGTSDVTIKGAAFPGIVERVVYNILGSGRTINTQNGVAGHIFAPQNIFNQPAGVTYGLVIAGDVVIAKQNNKPNCKNFQPVAITTKLSVGVAEGSTIIYVIDFPDFAVGDRVCINSDCHIIKSGFASNNAAAIVLETPLESDHSSASFMVALVSANDARTSMDYPESTTAETSFDFNTSFSNALQPLIAVLAFTFLLAC